MRFLPRALLVAGFAAAAAPAGAASLKVDYRVSLAGLTLGQADLAGTFGADRYTLRMTVQTTGLAGLISGRGRGSATSTGALRDARLVSSGFSATGRSSSAERTVRLGLAAGNVTAVEIEPPFQPTTERVEVTNADRSGVIDPLSAVVAVAPARGAPEDPANCNRTIQVFDGTQRFDVRLSFAETRRVTKPGFDGTVLVCQARYTPIAGHRTDRPSVRFMAENRDMDVWLAPVRGTRVLVPIRISVATTLGTSVVEAERWSVTDDGPAGELRLSR